MTSKTKKNKIVLGVLGLMLSLTLVAGVGVQTANAALTTSQVDAIISLLTSFGADTSTISNVRASLTGGTPSAPMTGTGYTFTRNLKQGDTGDDVKQLQMLLNAAADTQVSMSGAGSPGNETSTFGPATKAAVVKFQNKYASEVLTPVGLSSGTGFVGAGTRAKLNSMGGSVVVTPPTTPPTTPSTEPPVVVPSGLGIAVTKSPVQPSAQLAPLKAARIPFTNVTFTAGSSDVTVNGLVVERVGQSVDAIFDSVILLDETGMQVGLSKTLNSQHQATLTQSFVVKAGQTRTMTIAGNRPTSSTAAHAGMAAGLSLVQVNTGATVSGSFPITGTIQTINEGLTIGTVTAARGSLDPGTSVTKEVGITGYTFSSIRITAGSAENVRLKSVRWNQTQSAGASDLANIKVYVDGTAYDPVITDAGQYYTASFGSGIVLEKGYSKEISIKGDVIGGSGRVVDFDIAKRTDINLSGELYGYGIMPDFDGAAAAADGADVHNADDYYYDAAQLTIDVGSMNISTSNAAPAQNIAINTQGQPLGAFIVDVKGEPISVGRMAFNVTLGDNDADDIDDITNITLVDANGSVVAGPVDGTTADSSYTSGSGEGSFVFSDSVTFPVGQNTYFLKGKIGTDMNNNTTITASTTPSNDFATVRGLTTGKTITPAPTSALTFAAMTLKSGALTVSALTQPPAQTVIAGGKQIEFARYVFDATASGEDIRVTTVPLYNDATTGVAADLTNCQLRDGTKTGTSYTTGSNVKNPSTLASTTTFTFDGTGLLVTKGTSKTLSLTCDLKSGTSANIYWWGIDGSATWTGATGLASAQTIEETINDANGQKMTASSGGSYTVTADSSSAYDYRAVKAGTLNVPLAAFKFEADLTEELMIQKIALQLGNVASNSPADLENRKVTLWVDGVQVGEAQFGADTDYATSSALTNVKLGKGPSGVKTIVVKGDLRGHDANTNSDSTAGNGGYGAFLGITYDGSNTGVNGNYATGLDSGANVTGYTTDVTTNGVRIFKNVPTIRVTNLGANTLVTGDPVYKFTVTNPDASSDMMLYKVSFGISTSGPAGFNVQDFELRGGGVLAVAAVDGVDVETLNTTGMPPDAVEIVFGANEARRIPAGGSKEYVLSATVAGMAAGTNSLNVKFLNDTAYPPLAFLMGSSTGVNVTNDATSTNNFIWSPFSTTSPTTAATAEKNLDWTNSYGVPIYDKSGSLLTPTGSVSTQASEKAI
ncbi:MAG: hypothetical protein UY03_C0020G0010 [Parcubacteria group bacterium GW2011_GWA2_47_64]|nr:MAG: hypothetical protein UY03_C0020G0010 [Parcubacteria group bacterium GW2011_GWA2_47_64]KKU95788.1 MAG: hypothetical protein UY29_C0019G0008 [Parcubacteria group bacterium GW2011_GWC2_48_17]